MASRRFVHLDAVELTTGLRRRRLSSDPPARAEVDRRAARDPCARPPPRVERLAAEDDVVEVLPGARGMPVVPRRVPLARPGRSVDGECLPVELARVAGAGPTEHGVGFLRGRENYRAASMAYSAMASLSRRRGDALSRRWRHARVVDTGRGPRTRLSDAAGSCPGTRPSARSNRTTRRVRPSKAGARRTHLTHRASTARRRPAARTCASRSCRASGSSNLVKCSSS